MQYNLKRQFVSLAGILVWLLLGVSTQSDAQIDYGADKVNGMGKTAGTKIGGADVYPYLALVDHPGPSGVPVGGIGVGCFDYAPDGRFTRIGINNWHSEGGDSYTIGSAPGTFLAIWRDGKAHLLQRGKTRLFEPAVGQERASAVAVRLVLHPHETRTVRFLVSWHPVIRSLLRTLAF